MGLFSKVIRLCAAFAVFALCSSSMVVAQCTGNPPTYNGLPCATTTRYWDGQLGACGCGSNNSPYSWQWESYTAAGSQAIYDSGESSWCGSGCGSCYELTPTGQCPTGGTCAETTDSIVVMVTNLCPYNGNEEWCPDHNATNGYGYGAHFDLMDYNMAGLITELGWNNPVVTYRRVECGSLGSPTCADAATCECATGECEYSSSPATSAPTSRATSAPTARATSAPTARATSAPTARATSAPTAKATSAPSHATSAPVGATAAPAHVTSAPAHVTSAPASSGSCRAGISFAVTDTWNNGGMIGVTLSNTGTEAITAITLSIPGVANEFNLVASSSSSEYALPSWALPLAAGSSFTAGYTYSGARPAAGSVHSVSC